jgi:starvation-inducible DNA-binding protein
MKMQLHETKNDLHEKTRRAMIELLNQQLADVIDLGLQAKQAHLECERPALHRLAARRKH